MQKALKTERAEMGASTAPAPTVADRWYRLRNRILADARFQRFSSAFPLARPIANHHSRALFDLCAGFVYSQVLMTSVKLDLFTFLQEQPKSCTEIARHVGLEVDATERLLRAAVPLKLLERHRGDRYGLGILGAALLGNPGVLAMIAHHDLVYADLKDPVALLKGDRRGTALADYWCYASVSEPAELPSERVRAYTDLMAASQSLIAADVLDAYAFDRHQTLLDVGGGDGSFLAAAALRHDQLALMLFDLPAVAETAQSRFAERGLSHRAQTFGGDFTSADLPRGADCASLVRVLLDHDDATAAAILRQVHAALPVGGAVVLVEPIGGLAGAETMGDTYFGFYLLAMGKGRARSFNELAVLLERAGFGQITQRRTRRPLMTGLVTAVRQ